MFRGVLFAFIFLAASACHEKPGFYSEAEIRRHYFENEDAFDRLSSVIEVTLTSEYNTACLTDDFDGALNHLSQKYIEIRKKISPYLDDLNFPNRTGCIGLNDDGQYWMLGVHSGYWAEYDIGYSLVYSKTKWQDVEECGDEDRTKIYSRCISLLSNDWFIHAAGTHRKLSEEQMMLDRACRDSDKHWRVCDEELSKRIDKLMSD